MVNLRQKLEELTQTHDLERQLILMRDLQKAFNHKIALKIKVDNNDDKKYNCFMHALDVSHSEEIKSILQSNEDIIFGTKFIQKLINSRILSPSQSGTIIVYFGDNKPIHAGKFSYANKRVISKWGKGHLWEHEIFEIPFTYGELFKLFNSITPQLVTKEFQEFASREQNN